MPTTVMDCSTASPSTASCATPLGSSTAPSEPVSAESSPVSPDAPYPHKPVVVHRCGREFFKRLSTRKPEIDAAQHAQGPDKTRDVRLKMQGRSLINVLLVLRKRLNAYQLNDSATVEDVAHASLLLDDVRQRWATPDGFAACLIPVDAQMQHVCSKLYQECTGLLEKLKASSVDMPPDVKRVHDSLLDLKRECCCFVDGTDIRLHDIVALHRRIDQAQLAMASALRGEHVALGNPPPASTMGGLSTCDIEASQPRGHAVCADLLHDCHVALEGLWWRAHELTPASRDLMHKLVGTRTTLLRLGQEADHTEPELQALEDTLGSLNQALVDQQSSLPDAVQELASLVLQQCSAELQSLECSAVPMTRSMQDVHSVLSKMATRLLEIVANKQHISETQGALAAANSLPLEEVRSLEGELERLESQRLLHDGLFAGVDGELGTLPPGQALCASLMHRCHETLATLEVVEDEAGR